MRGTKPMKTYLLPLNRSRYNEERTWKGAFMGRVRFTPEQIIGKLREAELLLGQGTDVGEAGDRR